MDPSNDVQVGPSLSASPVVIPPEKKDKPRCLHVKGLPEDVWCRARCNAALSGMTFGKYVIMTLAQCQPFPRQ